MKPGKAARLLGLASLVSLAQLPATAQSALRGLPPLDSLQTQLRRPDLPDTTRVIMLGQIASIHELTDPARALREGQQGLQVARRAGFRFGEVQMLRLLARISINLGDTPTALGYDREVLRRAGHDRRSELIRTLALQDLAGISADEENYPLALNYYRQVLARMPNTAQIRKLGAKTILYDYLAETYLGWHEQQPADSLLRQALRYARLGQRGFQAINHDQGLAYSLSLLGSAQLALHRPDSAAYFLRQGLPLARTAQSPSLVAIVVLRLAECYTQPPTRWPEVKTLATEGLRIARELEMPGEQASAHELLAQAYQHEGRWQPAVAALRARDLIRDTLTRQDRRQTIARLSAEFDAERKESRIQELTQAQRLQQAEAARQQARLWGLLGGAGLLAAGLAVAAWLTVRLRRSRTALAARNVQLAEARATQDRLYSVIGHDLRTPLTALEGLATLIDYYYQPQHQDAAAMREVTQEVRQTTSQLTGLLDNLLHWAASQSGELAYRPEALDAAALLQESANLYAPAARARQVAVQVQVPAGLPPLWADRNMVLTQLRNLLGNALKVAPVGSAIRLSAQATAAGIELSVTDAGPGLSAAQLAALEQSAGNDSLATRLPGQRGTGLGLPLVRQLARRQQGSFGLDSALGRGTTARLGLPLASG